MKTSIRHHTQTRQRRTTRGLAFLATTATALFASSSSIQPVHAGNEWHIVGESGVSAQQLFRMQDTGDVMIIDKVENNPLRLNGAPASAVQYNTESNTYEAREIVSNAFCAGGNVLSNGSWIAVGGNKAVTYGGLDGQPGERPYATRNGGTAIRVLNPCPDGDCQWISNGNMQSERWYPTVETLQDGSLAIIGGMRDGGYVNTPGSDNPTIEYFPSKGDQIGLNILAETLPCNLYALTWLLPSGNLLIQSNLKTTIFDWQNSIERPIGDMPHAVRVYPASAATAMLPLTPANNWTATIVACGGTDLQPEQWSTSPSWNVAAFPADATCVSITPSVSNEWETVDEMFEGRSMGQFLILPDGRLFHSAGVATGTAGYGNTSWAIGQSYGDNPLLSSAYYDPSAPRGSRWSRPANLDMQVPRLYHSSATLLADGSILAAGSNPNADYIPRAGFKDERGRTYKYATEYRVEKFYPDYYNETRPVPTGLPTNLTYGGAAFQINLSAADLQNNRANADTVKIGIMRTGFSTHGMNMGMRYVQLNTTYTVNADGSATIYSEQMPPNPSIMAPGPALMFVVVNGIPSVGTDVMVGDGRIGEQTIRPRAVLPGTLSGSNGTPAVAPPVRPAATPSSSSSSYAGPSSSSYSASSSSSSNSRTRSSSSSYSAATSSYSSSGGNGGNRTSGSGGFAAAGNDGNEQVGIVAAGNSPSGQVSGAISSQATASLLLALSFLMTATLFV